jgi:hypothetical protein
MNDPVLSDGLLIFGFLVIVLAPMSLALAYTGPGGAGWKLLTRFFAVSSLRGRFFSAQVWSSRLWRES